MTSTAALYLVRHGETVFNREGRYQGQSDSPLTPHGRNQAAAVGRRLRELTGDAACRILASPLGRAWQTAEIVGRTLGAAPPVAEPRIAEVGMGDWDGLTRDEIRKRWPDARLGRAGREWMFHGPGGERLEEVLGRLRGVLAEVYAKRQHPQVLVGHGITGRLLRGLHADMPVAEALLLEAPQNVVFRLEDGGTIEVIDAKHA